MILYLSAKCCKIQIEKITKSIWKKQLWPLAAIGLSIVVEDWVINTRQNLNELHWIVSMMFSKISL